MRLRHVFAYVIVLTSLFAISESAAADKRPPASPDSVTIPSVRDREAYDRARYQPDSTPPEAPSSAWGVETRSFDGSGNNITNPTWGSAGSQFLRSVPADYADGVSDPGGGARPSARAISNIVCDQSGFVISGGTDYIWMWGQFVDHDIDLAATADPAEPFDIAVPMGDAFFDPGSTGSEVIRLDRSAYDPATGTGAGNPRQQINVISSYIDASNVYGSDTTRAAALRRLDGTGKMKTSAGNLLPFNTGGLENAGGPSPSLFLAGDVRANEQVALTALHTLFVREHNRLADEIDAAEPGLTGEEIYQRARAIVGAQMQVITYNEWLPALLGTNALPPYTGYKSFVNASVSNEFAAGAFRVGHTMLSPQLMRLNSANAPIAQGNLPLRDAFFAPSRITSEGGIDPLLRGGAVQPMQKIDALIIDDVRNFLFGPPGAGGFDLASLNLQRGREHGLPSYNAMCQAMGLTPAANYSDITSNAQMQSRFASVYGSPNDVDFWVGAISEDHVAGGQVGPLVFSILVDQFRRLRDGDRFWYQEAFSGPLMVELENTRLSDIIRRNTGIGNELQHDVFRPGGAPVPTVTQWGLAVLLLLGMTLATMVFGGRRAVNAA